MKSSVALRRVGLPAAARPAGAADTPASAFDERAQVRARRRLQRVGRDALARDAACPSSSTSTETSPSASVSAVTAATWYSFSTPGDAGRGVDRLEQRVDRAVAGALAGDASRRSGVVDLDLRDGRAARGVVQLERGEVVGLGLLADLVGDDRLQVQRGDVFFLSAISLKRLNAVFSAWPSTRTPSSSSALRSAWRPECLPSTIEFVCSPIVVASMIS